ncbi:hypothetical protein ACFZCK_17865 [Kitasatospora purpeofusca]|uniref:hypothetical protein n=1 Tax=Kitasatospora purpeofusca TaxID=67352 RepID=UPI0036E2C865
MAPLIAALVPTLIFGSFQVWQTSNGNEANRKSADAAASGEDREKRKEREEKEIAVGPPVSITMGHSDWLAVNYALPHPTYELGDLSKRLDSFGEWLTKNDARPIGFYGIRFTISALRDETAIIQDFKLKDRDCPNEVANTVDDIKPPGYKGTLVYPPPAGGSGEDVKRTVIGFEVSQYDTAAETLWNGYPKPGSVSSATPIQVKFGKRFSERPIALEKKDARTFDVYFAARSDCTFSLEVNVTSGSGDVWVPINAGSRGQRGGSIAAGAEPYDTLVKPTDNGAAMELGNALRQGGVPRLEITADNISPGS